MSKIICIETAAEVCSVAIADEGVCVAMREDKTGKAHSKMLTVFIEQMLNDLDIRATDLDAVAVSEGPGSYTGLRIGVSVAKGICYGAGLPLIGISTLESLTYGFLSQNPGIEEHARLVPMMDARRMEVYYAVYDPQVNKLKDSTPLIIDKSSFQENIADYPHYFFGDGARKCQSEIVHTNAIFNSKVQNSSLHLIDSAFRKFEQQEFVDLAYFEPSYLKPFIAIKAKNKVLNNQ